MNPLICILSEKQKRRTEDRLKGGHMLNLYHIPHYGKDIFIITYGEKTSSQ